MRAAVHADLVEQAQGVGLDSAGGDAEQGGDTGRPQAADDQLEHPRLGRPQLVEQLQRLHRQIELAAGLGHEHRLRPLVGVDDTQLFVDEDDARAERGEGGLERRRRLLAPVEQAADDGGAAQMRRQHAQAFDLGVADGRR